MQITQEREVQNLESFVQKKSNISEKDILLKEYDGALKEVENISFKNLIYVFIMMLLALGLLLPKIYISNEIYYMSKNINSSYHTYTSLKEENTYLKRELELVRYQIEVLDEIED